MYKINSPIFTKIPRWCCRGGVHLSFQHIHFQPWINSSYCFMNILGYIEAVTQSCSIVKSVPRNLKNSQENTFARVAFLIKLQAWSATLLKKRPRHRCFRLNLSKFLKTPFVIEHLSRLLLDINTDTHVFRQRLCSCEYFIYTPGFAE